MVTSDLFYNDNSKFLNKYRIQIFSENLYVYIQKFIYTHVHIYNNLTCIEVIIKGVTNFAIFWLKLLWPVMNIGRKKYSLIL